MTTLRSNLRSGDARAWDTPLADSDYLRRRLTPSLRDLDYLPLGDLLAAVSSLANSACGRIFDYGCGGTPYRDLFAHCESYVGADIVDGPRVDKILSSSGLTGELDCTYETVFSSQVLEHVPNPASYLAEAFRILRPGGCLIVTTHGMFLEHGCPNDFHRWTGFGLAEDVSRAGFRIEKTLKITPGPRASIYLVHLAVETFRISHNHSLLRCAAACIRRLYAWTIRPFANGLARYVEPRSMLPAEAPEPVYIGVGILARKP